MATKRGASSTSEGDGTFTHADSLQEIKRKQRARNVLVGVLAVMLAAVGTGTGLYLTRTTRQAPQPPCAACISDGSRIFAGADPAMRGVLAAIAKENATVRAGNQPYVSVMLLDPLTAGPGSDVSPARMVDELRGAYLAQVRMNAAPRILGIQLLLDDEGTSTEAAEGPAVRQLMTMEGVPDHVVAVAGLGVSTAQTAAAANALARDKMPMFGAVTSADEFNGHRFAGMVQAVPDVAAQVALLARDLTVPRSAVLVYDQEASDYYTKDLHADFSRAFAKNVTYVRPYTPDENDTVVEFNQIVDDVCSTSGPPPYVLYAGRESVLTILIAQFQGDPGCSGKKITMMTGGDADGLNPAATATNVTGQGQVSVIYTDIANLDGLTPAFKQSYEDNLATLDPGHTGLSDTWMVATYNAMMAVWAAIGSAYVARHPNLPTKRDVLDFVDSLNGTSAPSGATGRFSLDTDGKLVLPDIPIFEDAAGRRIAFPG